MNNHDWPYVLIDKFHSGRATGEEINKLEAWKKESNTNLEFYTEVTQLLDMVVDLRDWKQYNLNKGWKSIEPPSATLKTKVLPFVRIMGIAASFLIVITAFLWFYGNADFSQTEKEIVGIGQKYSLLPDGTEIYLKENALIDLNTFTSKNREIKTKGNFFVNISHNPDFPFTINTDKVSIRVLGTSFFVMEDATSVKVGVRDGKVLISNHDGTEVMITANEMFSLENGTSIITGLDHFDWGLYTKTYDDVSLFEVINDLTEQFGNIKFSAMNIQSNCRITTKINQSTIIEILEELSLIFTIDYTIKDGTIIVNKVSC